MDFSFNPTPGTMIFIFFQDVNNLRDTEASLQDTATLIGQVINLLPESLPEYSLAINLVELVNELM